MPAFCGQVNARPHRVTRRPPAEMLAEEQARLHPVPAGPFTAALGVTRKVDDLSLVTFERGPVLGAAPARRAGRVGPPARRSGGDHPRRARRPGRGGPAPGDRAGQPAGR